MSVFQAMNISASGLTAERLRMDVVAGNIANQNTTRTENGEAYRRKIAVFSEHYENSVNGKSQVAGVRAVEIVEDQSDLIPVYDPTHPDANEEGYYYGKTYLSGGWYHVYATSTTNLAKTYTSRAVIINGEGI